MNKRLFAAIALSACSGPSQPLSGHAPHGTSDVDALLCKHPQTVGEGDGMVLDVKGDQAAAITSPDGSRRLVNGDGKGGFSVVDTRTKKSVAVHNPDSEYDCDIPVAEGEQANSVRFLGNDILFAQGWYCSEFDAHPYLADAKTGRVIGALALEGVTPEAVYNVAHLGGASWAISIFDHNHNSNRVVVVDTRTAKVTATKQVADAELGRLPVCPPQ